MAAKQQSKKSQFQTPDTFKGLPLHSHCYGGCAICNKEKTTRYACGAEKALAKEYLLI